jgi:WD40 repeat protein
MIETKAATPASKQAGVARPPKERILTGRMAEPVDSTTGDSARSDSLRSKLCMIIRACPLCGAAIEVPEKRGLQAVECGACGLHCTVDASPPTVALDARLLEPIINVSPDVEHWLQRPPHPVPPEMTVEARRAHRRRVSAAVLGSLLSAALAAVAAFVGYQQANEHYTRRLAEHRAQAAESEAHLLAEKQRLEREREIAERTKAAAQREARLMAARFLAAQAQANTAKRPWYSVSTAIEAVNATLTHDGFASPEAHQSLRHAIARCPSAYELDGVALPGRADPTSGLAASPDGRWIAAASAGNSVRLWDLQLGEPNQATTLRKEHSAPVTHVLFSRDSRYLITGCEDSTASVWDLTADDKSMTRVVLPGREGAITKMAVSSNGRWLAVVFAGAKGTAETARLWDLAAGPQRATSLELEGHGRRMEAVAFSADSRWLALGVDDAIHVWDLAAHVPAIASVGRQCRHGAVTAALFTADGKWLVTAGRDGSARLWNLAAGDPSTSIELRSHRSPVKVLTASGDGRWLVTASGDRHLKIWDLKAKNPAVAVADLKIASGAIAAVEISPDGTWLAASALDGNAYLWAMDADGPTSKAVAICASRKSCGMAFTANSRWLATVGHDSVRLWNVDLHDLINRATSATLARRQLIAFRYAWLNPSRTVAGRILQQRLVASKYAIARHALAPSLSSLRSATTRLARTAVRRWEEVQPKLNQRMAALTAGTAPCVAIAQPAAAQAKPAAAARTAASRFELPRRATQGNSLRLYVH